MSNGRKNRNEHWFSVKEYLRRHDGVMSTRRKRRALAAQKRHEQKEQEKRG